MKIIFLVTLEGEVHVGCAIVLTTGTCLRCESHVQDALGRTW